MIEEDSGPNLEEAPFEEHDLMGGFFTAVRDAEDGKSAWPFAAHTVTSVGVAEFPHRNMLSDGELASQHGVDSAIRLANEVRHGSILDRHNAHIAISQIIHLLVEPYRGRVVPQPSAFTFICSVEDRLRGLRERAPRLSWPSRFVRLWTGLGFGISLVAAGWIVAGDFYFAAALITIRSLVSLTMATPGFASDSNGPARWSVDWRGCVVGQVTDALVLSALSGYLLANGHRAWGMATALVPILVLGATLLRVAAAQGGVVLGRLHLERVTRNGSLVVGLLLAGVFSHDAGVLILSLAFASAGAAGYALAEVARTLFYSVNRETLDSMCGAHEAFAKRVANVVPVVDAAIKPTAPVSNGSAA